MTLPQRVALFSFIFPVVIITICYYLSWQGGHVDLCNPYITGCEAITATGIYYPAAYVFRGLIIAYVSFGLWWYCAGAWLQSVRGEPLKRWVKNMVWVGMSATVMAVASLAVLGENMVPKAEHRDLWRFHVITASLFFLITSVCQILMAYRMNQLKHQLDIKDWSIRLKVALGVVQLIMLMAFVAIHLLGLKASGVEEIFEWWLATFCAIFFLTGFWDWKDFRLTRLEKTQTKQPSLDADAEFQGVQS